MVKKGDKKKSLDKLIKSYAPKTRNGKSGKQRKQPYVPKSAETVVSKPVSVFIGNLPWSTKWKELMDICKQYGSVNRADIAEENGRSKGYGIVVFASEKEAQLCIQDLNGKEIGGRSVTVKLDEMPGTLPKKGAPTYKVFVKNLPWSVKWQDLKDLCKEYGTVIRVDLAQKNGRSQGYCTIEFADKESQETCINNLNDHELEGRVLVAKIDEEPKKSIPNTVASPGIEFGGLGNLGNQKAVSTSVYVGNLPWSAKWQDLKDICQEYGNVAYAEIALKKNGQSDGYGTVRFDNAEAAQNCIDNLGGQNYDGRILTARLDKFN